MLEVVVPRSLSCVSLLIRALCGHLQIRSYFRDLVSSCRFGRCVRDASQTKPLNEVVLGVRTPLRFPQVVGPSPISTRGRARGGGSPEGPWTSTRVAA